MKTIFDRWAEGDYSGPGSFQQKIFEAFTLASASNQQRLLVAFPEWFDQDGNHTIVLHYELQSFRQRVMEAIARFSLSTSRMKLSRPVYRQAYDEVVFEIQRYGNNVVVLTMSQKDYTVTLRDLGELSVDDLVALLTGLSELGAKV